MSRARDVAAMGAVAFFTGVLGVVSINARSYFFSKYGYTPYRYTEAGGPFLALFDTIVAFGCGALLGVAIAVRLGLFGPESRRRWPWYVDIIPLGVLIYLIVVANFGRP